MRIPRILTSLNVLVPTVLIPLLISTVIPSLLVNTVAEFPVKSISLVPALTILFLSLTVRLPDPPPPVP